MLQLRPLSAALLAFGLLSNAAIFAADTSSDAVLQPVANSPAAKPDQALKELPYHPSLDLSSMDTSVDPCEDFIHIAAAAGRRQTLSHRIVPAGVCIPNWRRIISNICGVF